MSDNTYKTVNNKTVDNNSIKRLKPVLTGLISVATLIGLGFSTNSSGTSRLGAEVYEYRSLPASTDSGTNNNIFQIEDNKIYCAAPTYTNTGAEVSLATISDYEEQVNSLILQLKEDEENETFCASDYITNLYSQDSTKCISVLNKAFELQSYKYAPWVIDAIRLSDIDFLQQWFKNLLNIGMQNKDCAIYMREIYELYEEELATL